MKTYYIFTENEPIKIEHNERYNMFKIDNKWINVKSFKEQMSIFLDRIKQHEK